MTTLLARLHRELAAIATSTVAPVGVLGVTHGSEATVAYRGQPRTTPHTAFELGSVTKTFTALLLAEMAECGEVGYHDPISAHLPAHAVPANPVAAGITLAQLASHTAGLPPLPPNLPLPPQDELDAGANPYATYQLHDLYRATATLTPQHPPGQHVSYSNFGIGLLGRLLGHTADRDWAELILERVCHPLGLYDAVTQHAPHCTTGHRHGQPTAPLTMAALAPAGMLHASPADLLHYLHAQLNPDTTPLAAALRTVQRPQVPVEGRESMCLGWIHRRFRFGDVLFHAGGTFGTSTFIGFCPQTHTGVFALLNSVFVEGSTVIQAPYDLLKELARTHQPDQARQ